MGQKIELLDTQGNVAGETQIDFISAEVDNGTQSVLAKATGENSSGHAAHFAVRARPLDLERA